MKILLVGEYSGLHNSLKEGLIQLNHKVTLVSSGDNFKNYPSDFINSKMYYPWVDHMHIKNTYISKPLAI